LHLHNKCVEQGCKNRSKVFSLFYLCKRKTWEPNVFIGNNEGEGRGFIEIIERGERKRERYRESEEGEGGIF